MVDALRSSALLLRVEHRHGDDWVRLEPSPAHDVAESDPERAWAHGRIYRCPTCEEEVRVDLDRDDRTPG
jgi:hypothetical protein